MQLNQATPQQRNVSHKPGNKESHAHHEHGMESSISSPNYHGSGGMSSGTPPPESMQGAKSRIQFKLAVGAQDDAMEKEADSVADQVVQRLPVQPIMGTPPGIQRKCANCEQEDQEEGKIQKSSATNSGAGIATPAVSQQIQATQGQGQGMDGKTRSIMESSFGRDFSQVRIHASHYASQLNRDLQAHAFTVGSDIYFNTGRYAPESKAGQHLLAHELTHVVQQTSGIHRSSMIQRVCDTVAYDARVTEIRALPLFTAIPAHPDALHTPAEARTMANTIMTEARTRDNCMYFADKLHLLFSTPENPPSTIAAAFRPIMAAAETAENTRLATSYGSSNRLAEETAAADPARVYESVAGPDGKTFQIDRRDPANVFVKAKVFPSGDATAVRQLIATEDAIEKRASVLGYTVDLEFVTAAGPDVFEIGVDPGSWPDERNWVLGPETSAHELHHRLGLPDRYNYIEDHSPNADMYIADRIHWFDEEFRRSLSPLIGRSFMGGGTLIMDEDICETMHAPDMPACLASRRSLRQPGLDAKLATRSRILRIVEILTNVSTTEAERTGIQSQAAAALGASYVEADLIANLRTIADVLDRAEIQMENTSATECETETVIFTSTPAAYVICPSFRIQSAARKAHDFVRASSLPSALSITRTQELARFVEQIFDPTPPASVVIPPAPNPQPRPTSLLLGGGGGTDALALMELQQRIYTFAPRVPGGITIPIGLQGVLGLYGYPNRGSYGASLGVGADFQLAGRSTGTPLTFGLTGGGGGTIGGTNIGRPEPDQLELGAYARGGVYGTIGPVRITPQYQFNFLRNMGAGTDTQLHQFLLQLGYTF